MKVLVTGGAGFIGAYLVRELEKNNQDVVVVDNLSTGSRANLSKDINLIEMDICDERMAKFIAKGSFDAIVHLAGQTNVNESIRKPKIDAQANVIGTVNLLEAVRKSNVKRIVFASTAAVYGNVEEKNLPVEETQSLNPTSFYALTKITAESYFSLYSKIFGVEYMILRFANVYGELQCKKGEASVVNIFLDLAVRGKEITVYGDGKQTRDFVHAKDIARGIYCALTTENKNLICNLSTQTEISLNYLIELLEEILDKKIRSINLESRVGDIKRSSLSNKSARNFLNWNPQINLSDGLKLSLTSKNS